MITFNSSICYSMKNKISILVCCHKQDFYAQQYPFFPIHVGKAISNIDLGLQGDNIGDNISNKNKNYCELTALYWAWKNLKDVDVIGICHYRRYFLFCKSFVNIGVVKYLSDISHIECDETRIVNDLKRYDIILPNKDYVKQNLKDYYAINHSKQDFDILENVIKDFYPEYIDSFRHVMYYTNSYSPFNMMVCKKKLFDEYCEWLFGVLSRVEERVCLDNYTPYQARIFGFMSERLLNVFCYHQHLKVKHYKILALMPGKNRSFIKEYMVRVRAFFCFLLNVRFHYK